MKYLVAIKNEVNLLTWKNVHNIYWVDKIDLDAIMYCTAHFCGKKNLYI